MKRIEKTDCDPESKMESVLTAKYKVNEVGRTCLMVQTDQYVACEKWTIDLNGQEEIPFKVVFV